VCDTAVAVLGDRVLFAKNSDRDPNEAQNLEWQPRRSHPASARVRCTWIEIPQARETHAVLLSRPFWMFGAEMGANEHGVVIGNEAVFTKQPYASLGLTGMDLLRLALERAASAEEAVAVITSLLAQHGQGGGCGHEKRGFTYHNSFLAADARGAFVIETAGREWEVERVTGARSISNGLTIPGFAERHADRLRTTVASALARRECTQAAAARARGVADMFLLLRSHGARGTRERPLYRLLNGAMSGPCAHAGGLVAATQTTASWVAELAPGAARHWVTATAAPCTALFKPVAVDDPLELGPPAIDRYDANALWWRHERLHRAVARDPARLLPLYASERDAVEARWLAAPPKPADAFAEGEELLAEWTARVVAAASHDLRPGHVRRYWAARNARAEVPPA
jgi:dipeptidase